MSKRYKSSFIGIILKVCLNLSQIQADFYFLTGAKLGYICLFNEEKRNGI